MKRTFTFYLAMVLILLQVVNMSCKEKKKESGIWKRSDTATISGRIIGDTIFTDTHVIVNGDTVALVVDRVGVIDSGWESMATSGTVSDPKTSTTPYGGGLIGGGTTANDMHARKKKASLNKIDTIYIYRDTCIGNDDLYSPGDIKIELHDNNKN